MQSLIRGPTPAGRPPTTCAGCAARVLSSGYRTATATSSPRSAPRRRVLYLRPTVACLVPAWPTCIPGYHTPELARRSPLATAWRTLDWALDDFIGDFSQVYVTLH